MERDSRLFWLDAIRGVSALLVCAGHLRAAMFCDYRAVEHHQFWHFPFYLATGLGHQAVVIFFVLSGFLVGGSVIRNRYSFGWSRYFIARLSRLWTVLLPALVFTAVVDSLIGSVDPQALAGAYQGNWQSGPQPGAYSAGPLTFLSNLLFLQTIMTPVYGTNGPLWSLANEFWYYILFPLLMAVFFPRVRLASAGFLAAFILVATWLPNVLALEGLVWAMGAGVYVFCASGYGCSGRSHLGVVLFLAAVFGGAVLLAKSGLLNAVPLVNDFLVGAAFSVLLAHLIGLGRRVPGPVVACARWLADISYTLYLFHFPLAVAVGSLWLAGEQLQPTPATMALYLAWLGLIIGASHLAWLAFERHTDRVRSAFSAIALKVFRVA